MRHTRFDTVPTLLVMVAGSMLALGLLAGCATKQPPPPGPYAAPTVGGSLEQTETLVYLDQPLQNVLSVEGQRARYTSDSRLVAEANLRNLSNQPLSIQVQTVFKDEQNMASGDSSAWQTIMLNANATETYSTTALNAKSTRYTIRVRIPR